MAGDRRQESSTLGCEVSASKDPSHKNRSLTRRTSVWTSARKLIDAWTSLSTERCSRTQYWRLRSRRTTLLRLRRSAYARGGGMGHVSKYTGAIRTVPGTSRHEPPDAAWTTTT